MALLGTIIVLGVLMLDAHAALPEHHHVGGTETVCIASLALATLAIAAWAIGSRSRRARVLVKLLPARARPVVRSRARPILARAGPAPPFVLRR